MSDTCLYINLENLKKNIDALKSLGPLKNKSIIAVIKSDAYGHGLIPVAKTLSEKGINFFGVAEINEAAAVLDAVPEAKILMLKGVPERNVKEALRLNLRLAVISLDYLKMLIRKAKELGKSANIHIKYDSGMNRLGLGSFETAAAVEIINAGKNILNVEGLFSHLSFAGNDIEYTAFQINNYKKTVDFFLQNGIKPLYTHISASSSLLNDKITGDYSNTARPGISIYGINPNAGPNADGGIGPEVRLEPLMSLKSSVIQVKTVKKGGFVSYNNTYKASRDMKIAVVAAGYDNGIPRLLSNKGRFLINGKFAAVTGVITMNLTMADVTDIAGVRPGTEAIISGKSGSAEITVEEIARLAQTIPYEICLNFGKSNPRNYTGI